MPSGMSTATKQWLHNVLTSSKVCDSHPLSCKRLFDTDYTAYTPTPITFVEATDSTSDNRTNSKPKIYFQHMGRLGNIMFQYVGLYMLARYHDRELVIDEEMARTLNTTFDMKSRTLQRQRFFKGTAPNITQIGDIYTPREQFFNISTKEDFKLENYLIDWGLFVYAAKEVCQLFTFRNSIITEAKSAIVSCILQTTPCPVIIRTLVGIHVRMGDRVRSSRNETAANMKYYIHAMQYYRNKYPATHFIVATTERAWCEGNLLPLPGVSMLPPGGSAAVDLAALSLCDHTIMSIGTYGMWAGWLAGGEVVYFDPSSCQPDNTSRICMKGRGRVIL
jgi:galactoside 2-L-fucosyltransferase 1/2